MSNGTVGAFGVAGFRARAVDVVDIRQAATITAQIAAAGVATLIRHRCEMGMLVALFDS